MDGEQITKVAVEGPVDRVVNALSFDIEDYYQVSNFEHLVPFESWESYEPRVEGNTRIILEILADRGLRATFFLLGWVAARFPRLVREIADQGHELATHGYRHRLVYDLDRDGFREDLRRSIGAIEQCSGHKVLGHRAPSFSITKRSLWALEVLLEEGLRYDSSIVPIRHPRYGIPHAPRRPYEILPGLMEFPIPTVKLGPIRLPVAGGGYFRLYPYPVTRWSFLRLNGENLPAMLYLHPWEFDPHQPRLKASWQARFRHYRNLEKTRDRLCRLFGEFRFAPVREVLELRS